MDCAGLLPAGLIIVAVTGLAASARLTPTGERTVLVRLDPASLQGTVRAAAMADATLVAVPRPGFALLHGDASRIRAALGLAPLWQGISACAR